MNLPNILSIFRLCLAPVFAVLYLHAQQQPWFVCAALVLLLAGVTDVADGIIARRFGLITPLGKILDPLADKVMQATVAVCLWLRFPTLWPFVLMLALKETLQIIGSARICRKGVELASAKWFGKMYTVVFYAAALTAIAYPHLSNTVLQIMFGIVIAVMVFSFSMYIPVFLRLHRKAAKNDR